VDGPNRVDLILTDVVMRMLGAKGLAKKVAKSNPDLRVLFYSGYAEDLVLGDRLLEPGTLFLEKPFYATGISKGGQNCPESTHP
jgi:hypothetical protein